MIDRTIRYYLYDNYNRHLLFNMMPNYKNYVYQVNKDGKLVLVGFVDESKLINELEMTNKIYIEPFFEICNISLVFEDCLKSFNKEIFIELGDSFEIIQLFQCWNYSQIPVIVIANSVNKIEYNAFSNNICLKSFYGNNVKLVEDFAFYGCTNLEYINLNNCIELQDEVFSECISLNKVYAPKCVTIGDSCFPFSNFTLN